MRPDEHKKKKNAQYKKKHGIGEKGKEVKGQGRGKDSQSKDVKKEMPKKTEKVVDISKSSDSSDEDEMPSSVSSKTSFQRRKVVSNWDRYDLPSDDEIVTPKGENFSKLLQVTGDSTSQFKFKEEEEEEWITPEQSDLSLNLQDLSSSIACVPLYKVLRLNKDLFSVEQIEEYDRQSAENQKKYQSKQGNEASNKVSIDNKKPFTIESTALDELLDSVCIQPKTNNNQQSLCKKTKEEMEVDIFKSPEKISLENDLDDLLSSDEQRKDVKENKDTAIFNPKGTTESQENDLEDWLDSVLDS